MDKVVVLITGSRSINDREKVFKKLDELFNPRDVYTLIEGEATGVDKIAADWCQVNYVHLTPMKIPGNYHDMYGKAAGNIRNRDMLNKALEIAASEGCTVKCVAIWDGHSSGTQDMIKRMRQAGLDIEITLAGVPKTKRLL